MISCIGNLMKPIRLVYVWGDWKMVVKKGTPFLYNLATDIHEDHDIAAGHPDIVKQMKEIIRTQHTPNPHFSVTLPSFE